MLEVEWGALVDLHGLGEHIDWLAVGFVGVVCAASTAWTAELASVSLVAVLLILLVRHYCRPSGDAFLLKVVNCIGEGVLSSEMLM